MFLIVCSFTYTLSSRINELAYTSILNEESESCPAEIPEISEFPSLIFKGYFQEHVIETDWQYASDLTRYCGFNNNSRLHEDFIKCLYNLRCADILYLAREFLVSDKVCLQSYFIRLQCYR
jgi:hypothetical protein